MAVKGHCGRKCAECKTSCIIDETIPCSPDCKNLTTDGRINIKRCLEAGCEEVKYIFDMARATNEEILARYGNVAQYPYGL